MFVVIDVSNTFEREDIKRTKTNTSAWNIPRVNRLTVNKWCQDQAQRVHPCQAHSEFKEFKNQAESSWGQSLLIQSKGLPPSLGVLNL